MNVYDSQLVAGLLQQCGYNETNDMSSADVIFLNTCAIREKAEETVHNRLESIQYLKKQKPHLIFGVLGCMAQNIKDDLLESKPYVDVILGPDSYRRIPEIINSRNKKICIRLILVYQNLKYMKIYFHQGLKELMLGFQ